MDIFYKKIFWGSRFITRYKESCTRRHGKEEGRGKGHQLYTDLFGHITHSTTGHLSSIVSVTSILPLIPLPTATLPLVNETHLKSPFAQQETTGHLVYPYQTSRAINIHMSHNSLYHQLVGVPDVGGIE